MSNTESRYAIKLSFETIQLPPFQDILVLGRNAPHGKTGISRTLDLLAPDCFETVEIQEANIEAIYISRQILSKIPREKVIHALKKKVFPFVANGELLRVDFKVDVMSDTIEYEV